MLFMLFKLQSNQCPLADSGIIILKDTIPVRKPMHDEMKVIAPECLQVLQENHYVSSY